MIVRRAFLTGLASAFAAPAIVRVQNIMPVKVMPSDNLLTLIQQRIDSAMVLMRHNMNSTLYYGATDEFPPLQFNGHAVVDYPYKQLAVPMRLK